MKNYLLFVAVQTRQIETEPKVQNPPPKSKWKPNPNNKKLKNLSKYANFHLMVTDPSSNRISV